MVIINILILLDFKECMKVLDSQKFINDIKLLLFLYCGIDLFSTFIYHICEAELLPNLMRIP